MKYFTKYLPVAGEIKEGDWFTWQDEGTDHPYLFKCIGLTDDTHLQVKWDKGIGCYWNNSPNEAGYGDWNKAFAKKVKLFLCSRDIQVGDEVQDDDGVKFIIDERRYNLLDKNYPLRLRVRKIIGEISPAAVWVKEGQELDEEQLEHGGGYILFYDEHLNFWTKLTPAEQKLKQDNYDCNYIKIKCPTCGTFH